MTHDDLRERVAKAMRNVYLARQPKYSGAGGYPLEEFLPEADAAIAIALEEAARVAESFPARTHGALATAPYAAAEQAADEIAAAIRALATASAPKPQSGG